MKFTCIDPISAINDIRNELSYTELTEVQIRSAIANLAYAPENIKFVLGLTAGVTELVSDIFFDAVDDIPEKRSKPWLMGIAIAEAHLARELKVYLGLEKPLTDDQHKMFLADRYSTYPCPWERSSNVLRASKRKH